MMTKVKFKEKVTKKDLYARLPPEKCPGLFHAVYRRGKGRFYTRA